MISQKKLVTGEFMVLYEGVESNSIVLMIPGIGYSKVGPYFLLSNIAQSLYQNHKNAILFDYYGLGDSDGEYSEVSYESLLKSARNVLSYLRKTGYQHFKLIGLGIGNLICNELCMEDGIEAICLIDYNPELFLCDSSDENRMMRNLVGLMSKTYIHPKINNQIKFDYDILNKYKKCTYPIFCMDEQVMGRIAQFLNSINEEDWANEVALAKAWDDIKQEVVLWESQLEVDEELSSISDRDLTQKGTQENDSNNNEILLDIDGLQGILYTANEKVISTKRRCIIYEPGLGGDRIDYMNVGTMAGRKSSNSGFFFFRYDFYGCGTSEGEFYKFCWSNKFQKLHDVIHYLKKNYNIEEFMILSYSEGAKTAIWASKECSEVKATVMFSPVLINGFINYQNVESSERKNIELPKFIKDKRRGIVLPTQAYYLSLNYFTDQKKNELYENLEENDKPLLIVYGNEDCLFQSDVYLSSGLKIERQEMKDGHLFNYSNTCLAIDEALEFFLRNVEQK